MTQRLYNRLQDIIVVTIYQEPESFFYDGSLRVQAQMLAKFEGKTIDFVVGTGDQMKVVQGRLCVRGRCRSLI